MMRLFDPFTQESKNRYGAPKIQKALDLKGIKSSLKRVQRHMVNLGLKSIVVKNTVLILLKRRWKNGKFIEQGFHNHRINQKWCTDITYIHTVNDGWTYLASVMDFHSKKIIGYAYSKAMTAEMAVKAIENAHKRKRNNRDHTAQRPWNPIHQQTV